MTDEKAVNLALVGTGAWSGSVGDAMRNSTKVNLVTCFDDIRAKREAFSAKFDCDCEESFENVLKRADIDGIHLATPNQYHPEQTLLAARYGKHVFVEKPIANTPATAKPLPRPTIFCIFSSPTFVLISF